METAPDDHIIVIVLASKTMEQRWVEIPELVDWFCEVKRLAREKAEKEKNSVRPSSTNHRKKQR
jgi:hypothetical protein